VRESIWVPKKEKVQSSSKGDRTTAVEHVFFLLIEHSFSHVWRDLLVDKSDLSFLNLRKQDVHHII